MTDVTPILLGTRGSKLALWQAETAGRLLTTAFSNLKVVRQIIKTTGDRRTDVSLAEVAKAEGVFDKGVFIKELETALDDGSIDIAVHSLKDMPTVLEPRFQLAAVLERGPIRDTLVTRTRPGHPPAPSALENLPPNARVGTSSVRRARQITHLRPDVTPVDIRGNVPTRLEKLANGTAYDAILLAEAGLVRLGFLPDSPGTGAGSPEPVTGMPGIAAARLDESLFLPAAGQGAVGLEIRSGDLRSLAFCDSLRHADTWLRITAEREFLRLLGAGCHTPVGVHSTLTGGELHLRALVFPESGNTAPLTSEARGTDPVAVAESLHQSLK